MSGGAKGTAKTQRPGIFQSRILTMHDSDDEIAVELVKITSPMTTSGTMMCEQEKQDEFNQIVLEDAASEPGGCLVVVAVAALTTAMMIVGGVYAGSSLLAAHEGFRSLTFVVS
jgi:hypothetical protein